ncbi:MAG TPA: HAMP domain-containing sensor histidine kinase [Burkholderiales bacterium]|nr:HAMP domain-containing sensor histidine kinase [Burkholderiales bacterium]
MRLPPADLRTRIAVVLAAICIAVVAVLGVMLFLASEDMQEGLVEQLVSEELDALIERAKAPAAPLSGGGPNLQYYVVRSSEANDRLPAVLRALPPGQHEVGRGDDERHVAVREVDGTRYVVVYDSGPHEVREARFRTLLLAALAVTAVVAMLLGHWLAGVLTRQLKYLATRVRTLTPGEACVPLERPGQDREVAALAHALDDYHARLTEMMHREQEFTANASHELRTPLTAIRTSCELLGADTTLGEKARSRIAMVDHAARQMTDRMEALLLLARAHQGELPEPVALRRCVEDTAAPFGDEIARKGLTLEIAIPEESVVTLDRKALQLVLANLIRNAVRYTDRGYVRVSCDGRRISVADSGAGIAPEHRSQVFERHYRAESKPEGLGLGLSIVRRICDDLGWKIDVQSTPGQGSTFSLVF